MPYINDDYRPPFWFKNNHINTISAALFRRKMKLIFERKRFKLKDADFVDLDFVITGAYRDWETDRKCTRLNSSH